MLVDIFAGTMGGIAVVLMGHPFDTTKIRLQTAPAGFYKNTMDCVQKTFKWEGIGGFYAGIGSPLAGQMFFRATSFATFHNTITYLNSRCDSVDNRTSVSKLLMAGAVTGFFIAFVESPIDLVKTKLQVQIFAQKTSPNILVHYNTMPQCVQYIWQYHGPKALFQGLTGTLVRNVPANAVFFPVNEIVKRYFAERDNKSMKEITVAQNMVAGASAGLCYWVGTYPLDVIKSRMQSAEFGQSKGWLATFQDVWRSGGFSAFRTGLLPCAMRAVPACATMFTTVDFIRNYFQ